MGLQVLTLGCGKFRIFDQDFGALPGTQLPRLLDMGQCNDAYSALVVAMELAKVFNTDVNGLPLSLDISWCVFGVGGVRMHTYAGHQMY